MEKNNWQKVIVNNNTEAPQSRWGQSSIRIAESIIFFAGYANAQYMNDIWEFNTLTMEWIQHKTKGEIPMTRSNCTMHYDAQHNNIIVFGGGGPNKKRFNDVYTLNWSTKQWKEMKPQQSQKAPWERTYHSSELLYPFLIIFGGQSLTDHNDLWTFNLQTHQWQQIIIESLQTKPIARRFHTSVIINQHFYVIAGCYDKYRCLNDVYEIDFSNYLKTGNSTGMQWKQLKLKNNSFLARWGHSSAVYNQKIYIFGGRFSNDLQDIIVIDPELQTSKSLKVMGQLPKARRRHSCIFVGSCMVIFGGFNGQYFNDLYFIKIMNIKLKSETISNNLDENLLKLINSPKMSDETLKTKDNTLFYIHCGLIHDKFKRQEILSFLYAINLKYSEAQLRQIFEILYTGIGDLSYLSLNNKYEFNLFETLSDKQTHFKKQIISNKTQQSIVSNPNQNSPVIVVEHQHYKSMTKQRQDKYSDLSIIFNEEFFLPVNKALLAANSLYFSYLLNNYQQSYLQISLAQQLGDIRVFQVLINFLETGYVIIPKQLDWKCWSYIYRMADYFCLKTLTKICQVELIKEITVENYQEIFTIALEYDLLALIYHCNEFNFDQMVKNKQMEQLKSLKKGSNNKREQMLYEIYEMQKFSLRQLQMKRTTKISDVTQKKGPEKEQVKQNAFKMLQ